MAPKEPNCPAVQDRKEDKITEGVEVREDEVWEGGGEVLMDLAKDSDDNEPTTGF